VAIRRRDGQGVQYRREAGSSDGGNAGGDKPQGNLPPQRVSVNMVYLWRKRFLEGGRLALETGRRAESCHIRHLQLENDELKRMLAEERLVNRLLKGGLGRGRRT